MLEVLRRSDTVLNHKRFRRVIGYSYFMTLLTLKKSLNTLDILQELKKKKENYILHLH